MEHLQRDQKCVDAGLRSQSSCHALDVLHDTVLASTLRQHEARASCMRPMISGPGQKPLFPPNGPLSEISPSKASILSCVLYRLQALFDLKQEALAHRNTSRQKSYPAQASRKSSSMAPAKMPASAKVFKPASQISTCRAPNSPK